MEKPVRSILLQTDWGYSGVLGTAIQTIAPDTSLRVVPDRRIAVREIRDGEYTHAVFDLSGELASPPMIMEQLGEVGREVRMCVLLGPGVPSATGKRMERPELIVAPKPHCVEGIETLIQQLIHN
jgi:hypothetical protein